ncbi:MAG: HAMP domain-containing protein, partial [Clostridia bacterium]|nr:HAMP domain-containing protein [Clostridia bacterium]
MFKRRLNFYYIILISISLLITGFIIAGISEKSLKKQVESELRANAGAASFILENNESVDFDAFADDFSKKLNSYISADNHIRVTVVTPDGVVVGDSSADIDSMDNHRLRPEIIDAARTGTGLSERKSDTTGIDYMYFAVLLSSGNILRLSISLDYIKSISSTIYLSTLLAIFLSLLVASVIGFRLSKSFADPISKLSEHSAEISKGNYSHRIPHFPRKDELSVLIESYNKMTEDLEKAFSETSDRNRELSTLLNAINDGIIAVGHNYKILFANKRINSFPGFEMVESGGNINLVKNSAVLNLVGEALQGKTSINREITTYTLMLSCNASYFELDDGPGVIISIQDITRIKQLEKIRYEFVSNVTHELNTPLTSIKGFIETLKDGAIGDSRTAMKFLNIIEIESERLGNLINDILTLSSIENETTATARELVNIRAVANDALILLSNSISEKSLKVDNMIDGNASILADSDRIKQLFINLLDNAVKYNINGGSISLTTEIKGGMVEIHIKDTGIGIDATHLHRLFERFYRVDKGRSRELGGTGLG